MKKHLPLNASKTVFSRALVFLSVFLLPALSMKTQAQFNTPTVNGTIAAGEYGTHTNGQNQQTNGGTTYVTWDNTNLYFGITGAAVGEGLVIYLDTDPIVPVNGGTNANGTLVGFNYDNTSFADLPFRANLVAYVKNGYQEYRLSNGIGGWTGSISPIGTYSDNGTNVREWSMPWAAVGGIPASFNFFSYVSSSTGFVYNQLPSANPGSAFIGTSALYSRYFTVSTTTNGSATKPFSRESYTFVGSSNITGFGAITVWDFTVNKTGLSLTRAAGAGGAWTINGTMVVGNTASTLSFGTSTNLCTANNIDIRGGTLTLSGLAGGDLAVSGNFTKTAGTFNCNNRQVDFNGSGAQTFSSNATENINFFRNSKSAGTLTIASSITLPTSGNTATFNANTTTVINSGAVFQFGDGMTWNSNNAGTSVTVNGTLRATGVTGPTITSAAANLTIGGTGTYDHNMTRAAQPNLGVIPTATWNSGSTCLISGYTATSTAGQWFSAGGTQNFSNFTWNCPAQTNAPNFGGATVTALGTFTMTSTGTSELRLGSSTNGVIACNNFTITGGTINFSSGTGSGSLNITGNYLQSGGTLNESGSGSGTIRFQATSGTQTITQSAGTIANTVNLLFGSGSTNNTVQFLTNLNMGTGVATYQTNNLVTVDFQGFVLSGSGNFIASSGSSFITANVNGINTTGASGSVQNTAPTRTFTNTNVSYTYNGGAGQVTGTAPAAPASINNLTINNASDVGASGNITVNGTMTLSNGRFVLGALNLTIGSAGSISGASTSRYIQTNSSGTLSRTVNASAVLFPVGNAAFNPITFNNSGTSDVFAVRVTNNTPTSPNNSNVVVNRQWLVSETVAGGSNISVIGQWNSPGEEAAGFGAGTQPLIGMRQGGSWFQTLATQAGSNPFTFTSSSNFTTFSGSAEFALGKDDAFSGPAPIISSFSPSSGYTGDVITINGLNLTGLTSVTIGGVAGTILTQTGATATVQVNAGANGLVTATNASGSGNSATNFTWLGFITTASGPWGTPATWRGNLVPTANSTVTIASGHNVSFNVSSDPNNITIQGAGTLNLNTDAAVLGGTNLTSISVSGTLTSTSALISSNRLVLPNLTVNSGAFFVNNAGNAAAFNIQNMTISNGATYTHNAVGSTTDGVTNDFPGSVSRTLGATSTCNINSWANGGATPVTLPAISYGNLSINVSNLQGTWNWNGNITTINGNFVVSGLNGWDAYVSTSINTSLFVGGNVLINNGSLFFGLTNGTANVFMNVNGTTTIQGYFILSTGSGFGYLRCGNTFNLSATGILDNFMTGSPDCYIEFNGFSSQNAIFNGTINTDPGTTWINYRMNNNVGVNLQTTNLPVAQGAKLRMSSGTLTNGTVTYGGSNYLVYDGNVAQTTSIEYNSGPVDYLEIANTALPPTVTASNSFTAGFNITLTSGILVLGANDISAAFGVAGGSSSSYIRTNGTGRLLAIVGAPPITFPVGNSSYNPIVLTNSGTSDTYGVRVTDGTPPSPFNATKVVNRSWVITENVAGGSNLALTAQWASPADEAANFATGTINRFGRWDGSVWVQNGATQAGTNPKTFSTTANFTALGTFAVGKDDAFINPSINYTWTGGNSGLWADAGNWSPSGIPTAIDNVTFNVVGTNPTNFNTTQTVQNLTLNGTGSLNLGAAANITVTGTLTYANTATANFNCTSTFNIASTSAVTVPGITYGNLNITGGARTLDNTATISVCGTFTPGAGPFTIAGSTLDFIGSGAQTIPVFNYNNLTISNNRGGAAITLASGTIDVNGVFNPSLTNFTVTNTGNTFNYSGAAGQTIAAFLYNNLSSANLARTLANSGIIGIAGTFTPGTGVYTTTGSTVAFNANANQTIPIITTAVAGQSYRNVQIDGSATSQRKSLAAGTTFTGNLVINGGEFAQSVATQQNLTIQGDLTLNGGRFLQHFGSAASAPQTIIGGNFTQFAGSTFEYNNNAGGTQSGFVTLNGNFNRSGGGTINTTSASAPNGQWTFNAASATYSHTGAGGNLYTNFIVSATTPATLNLNNNFSVTDGNFSVGVGATLNAGNFTVTVSRTGGTRTFTLNNTATLRTSRAGGVSATISLVGGATATYNAGAYYVFDGNNQASGFNTTPVIATVGRITWLGTGNFTLGQNVQVDNQFNFTNSGLILLGANTLTLAGNCVLNGAPFSNTKMFVTDGAGFLRKNFVTPGPWTFTWPIGDNTAGDDYAPATLTITSALSGSVSLRTIDAVHPSNAPAINFISRYWNTATTFSSATWNGNFTYTPADINGTETAMKLNIWDNTLIGWSEFASSSAGSNVLTVTTGPTQNDLGNDDITGRTDVPVYYRTIAAGPNVWSNAASWEVSSDPAFISPAPVAAGVAPNSVNSAGILIRAGHTINNTGTVTADDLNIEATGVLNMNAGSAFILGNGIAATDLLLNGTLNVNAGTFTLASGSSTTINGTMRMSILSPAFTSTGALIAVNSGGIYDHNADGGTVPTATWNSGSLLRITGVNSNVTGPGGISAQTFYNVEYNCPSQTVNCNFSASPFANITNDFTIISTGTTPRDFRMYSGSTGGTSNIGGNLIVQGGILALANGGGSSSATININVTGNVNISGGVLTMSGSGSPNANIVNLNVTGDMNLSGSGRLDYNLSGGGTPSNAGTMSVNVRGNLSIIGTAQITRTTPLTIVPNFRFNKASGIQTYSAAAPATAISSFPCNWVVGFGGSTGELVLNNDMTINTAGTATVSAAATLDCGTFVLGAAAGTSTFTLMANSTLKMGSTSGITASAASGNIQTNTRTYATTAHYVYKGSANQVTGDGLPATVASLTIANTGGASNNIVTLTRVGTTSVSTNLNLNSGEFFIGSANTINMLASGSVLNNGGALSTTGAGGQDGGTVNFAGAGTIGGTFSTTFYNLTINTGAVNNSAIVPFINGTFRINGGNLTAPPIYNSGSTLQYNSTYGRFVEWNAIGIGTLGTTPGYPDNVLISAGSVDVYNGASGEIRACDGDLTVNGGTTLTMSNMNAALIVRGNLSHTGTLTMSTAIGGDIQIRGDWTRVGGATFNTNSRQVIFNGSVPQSIFGTVTYAFLKIDNSNGVTLNNTVTVANEIDLTAGNVTLGTNNLILGTSNLINGGTSSYINTDNTGVLQRNVPASSTFFPVGRGATYAPATLTQNGTAENIGVRLQTTIDNPVNDATKVVNLQWTLSESVGGSNNITSVFQWNTADEAGSFNRVLPVYQGHWTGSTYGIRTSTVSGTNPWISTSTQTYTGTLGAGTPFVLGNFDGLKGCYATAVTGDWNNPGTWLDGVVPPAGASICIDHTLTVNVLDPSGPRDITIGAAGSLNINASRKVVIDPNGFLANNGSTSSLGSGTLEFAGTGVILGTQASTIQNLTINGGTTLTTIPTINGTFTLNAGAFLTGTPVYGSNSVLLYNTGGPYNVNAEWTGTGIVAGSGVPAHVHITGTTLTMPASARGIAGNLQILSGGLNLNGAFGADLELAGNWTRDAAASFNPNNNAVIFSAAAGNQVISVIGGGTETFHFLLINKASGNVVLSSSPATNVTINTTSGSVLQLLNTGGLDLNGQTMSLTNNGGSILVNGPSRSIGGAAGSVLSIQGNKSVTGAGTLTFGSGTNVVLLAGMDFGPSTSTINGSLSIALGGFVSANPPTYNNLSRLRYICGCSYARGLEWSATSGPGYPYDVEVEFNGTPTTLNLLGGGSALRQLAGNLNLLNGGTLNMGTMVNPLVIEGNLNLSAGSTLTLASNPGGDLQLKGNWNQTAGSTVNLNSREVTFNGIALQTINGPIPTFAFVRMDNPSTVQLVGTSMTVNNRLWLSQGTFDHNSNTITMANGSQVRRSLSSATMTVAPTIGGGNSIDLRYDATMTNALEFPNCLDCIRDLEISAGTLSISGNRTINRDLRLAGDLDLATFTFTHRGRVASVGGSGNIEITSGARTITGAAGSSYLINGLGANQPAEYTKVVTNPGAGTLNFGANVLVGMGDGRMNWGAGNPVTINGTLQVLLGGSTFSNACFYAVGSTLRFANNADYQVNASDLTWAAGAIGSGLPGIPFNVEIRDNGTDLNINDVRAVRNDLTITSGSSSLTLNPALTGSFNVGGNWTRNSSTSAFNHNNKKVVFDRQGAGNQSIIIGGGLTAETFYDLEASPASGDIIVNGGNVNVLNELRFTSGRIDLNGFELTLGTTGSNGSLIGGGASTYFISGSSAAKFVRYATVAGTSYSFPIGAGGVYTPITISLYSNTSVTPTSRLTSYVIAGAHPNLGTSTNYLNRYWNIEPIGFGATTHYGVSYVYNDADVIGLEPNIKPFKYNPSGWIAATGSGALFEMGTGTVNPGTNTIDWQGLYTFSDFTGNGNGSPLPITLLDFDAQAIMDHVELTWSTASEINNDFFTIERSLDGQNFEAIGIVDGAGNSNQVLNYRMIDTNPAKGYNYYRLKQTDFDGNFDYSDIRVVNFKQSIASSADIFSVYPNPSNGSGFTIRTGDIAADRVEIRLTDMLGKEISVQTLNLGANSSMPVSFGDIERGIYHLTLSDGSRYVVIPVVFVR